MTTTTETRTAKRTGGRARARARRARRSGRKVMRRWGGRSIRGAHTRVVLRAAPGESNTGVADGVSLHLVDRHFCSMTVDELDETAALSRRNLNIRNLTKALEEGSQFVLSYVARQTTNEHRGVVRVGKLIHGERIEASCALTLLRVAIAWLLLHPWLRHSPVDRRRLCHLMTAKLLELSALMSAAIMLGLFGFVCSWLLNSSSLRNHGL